MVRGGADVSLTQHDHDGRVCSASYRIVVYREMLFQIMIEFSSLPNFKELESYEIALFYDNIRRNIKERQKVPNVR